MSLHLPGKLAHKLDILVKYTKIKDFKANEKHRNKRDK